MEKESKVIPLVSEGQEEVVGVTGVEQHVLRDAEGNVITEEAYNKMLNAHTELLKQADVYLSCDVKDAIKQFEAIETHKKLQDVRGLLYSAISYMGTVATQYTAYIKAPIPKGVDISEEVQLRQDLFESAIDARIMITLIRERLQLMEYVVELKKSELK